MTWARRRTQPWRPSRIRSATDGHLELRAGHVLQQLVGGRPLAERPELAQQVAGLAPREPVVPELAAQELAQLRLERPRAEVAGDVEAAVDVVEVALRVDRELQRVGEELGVAAPHRLHGSSAWKNSIS